MKGINIKPTFLETNIDLSKFIFLFNVIVEFEKNVILHFPFHSPGCQRS